MNATQNGWEISVHSMLVDKLISLDFLQFAIYLNFYLTTIMKTATIKNFGNHKDSTIKLVSTSIFTIHTQMHSIKCLLPTTQH